MQPLKHRSAVWVVNVGSLPEKVISGRQTGKGVYKYICCHIFLLKAIYTQHLQRQAYTCVLFVS